MPISISNTELAWRSYDGQVKVEPAAVLQCGFGKQQIATTGTAADGKVLIARAQFVEQDGNGFGGGGFLSGGEAWLGTIRRVDHVAAEQEDQTRLREGFPGGERVVLNVQPHVASPEWFPILSAL